MNFFDKILMSKKLAKLRARFSYFILRMEKSLNVHRCMEYLNWIYNGEYDEILYCEFGVANGYTMSSAYHISQMYENLKTMRFIGFDSFHGLPKAKSELDYSPKWNEGNYAFEEKEVVKYLLISGIPESKFSLVQGLFSDTLNKPTAEKNRIINIAYVHIDCDYYSSAKEALDFIKPYLIDGAVIDFDDYFTFASNSKGEPLAFSEWLDENGDVESRHFSQYGSGGNSFTVSFKDAS